MPCGSSSVELVQVVGAPDDRLRQIPVACVELRLRERVLDELGLHA